MRRHCILIGMPGCGKSTVGRAVARELDLPFADSDSVIEQRIGGTIRAFFETEGEEAFRALEQEVLDGLTLRHPGVLATGGGAVLRAANRQYMRERGTVFYLHASPRKLYRRLRRDTRRPLLQVPDPRGKLEQLYTERDPLYRECAHFVINSHRASRTALVNRIVMQVELMPEVP